MSYPFQEKDRSWQERWEREGRYTTQQSVPGQENLMLLVEFPYPSGNLHTGHWYAFAVPDILARMLRAQGKNVMLPMGFDAFGLPAENAAIKHGVHPREWTEKNIASMKKQFSLMGATFDWSREVSTIDPAYYAFTQQIFLELFKAGLAYRATTTVNWDPVDKTVLANEQVLADGTAERSGAKVEQKEIEQWMMRISTYADRLVDGLDTVDWPDTVVTAQRNWIGRSRGALIPFETARGPIEVFTTRPDTLYGVTFLTVSPELVRTWIEAGAEVSLEVKGYVEEALNRKELDRLQGGKQKSGIDTGLTAIHPLTKETIPVWCADYVLGSYGTGAVMGVPAHDERDQEFAEKFNLPIIEVIDENGLLLNSGPYTGSSSESASDDLVRDAGGRPHTTYRLRDWVISRQRYWGVPIPIIKCEACGYIPVPKDQLPVLLPDLDAYLPTDDGQSPLARATEWVTVPCPACGKEARRETDTMDTFVDSSWYYFRYTDPKNPNLFASPEAISAWLPASLYIGGPEHNTLHLLYSRFIALALHDLGLSPIAEPFAKRINHGIVLGPDGQKMSKSKGNTIDPDELVRTYGSDTVRMYLAFMAPYESSAPWDPRAIMGVHRFIHRVYDFILEQAKTPGAPSRASFSAYTKTLKAISEELPSLKFNTSVAHLMKLFNHLETESSGFDGTFIKNLLILIHPFMPHAASEAWEQLGFEGQVDEQPWPEVNSELLVDDEVTIVVQVNGKLRGSLTVSKENVGNKEFLAAEAAKVVESWISTGITNTIVIPGKLVNFVVQS